MAQDGLAAFEPAFADELAVIIDWAFDYMQRDGEARADLAAWPRDLSGGSVYLRLSTRSIEQPPRKMGAAARRRHHSRRLLAACRRRRNARW